MERGRSGAQRNAVPRSAEIGILALEGFHFLALNKCRVLAHAVERRQNLITQSRISVFQIKERNFHQTRAFPAIKTLLYREPHHKVADPDAWNCIAPERAPRYASVYP